MQVLMSPFSGPKGSPFDGDVTLDAAGNRAASPNNASTGALSTGIGYGSNVAVPGISQVYGSYATGFPGTGFDNNEVVGTINPDGTTAADARLLAIGGGRCNAATVANAGIATTNPYAAQPLLAFGNGASRDAGAGPAYTGFGIKCVQAASAVADGAVLATGFTNRSGATVPSGAYQFGISTTASAAVT